MRVLIVMQHVGFFRNIEPLVRELDRRGHEIVLLHGSAVRPSQPSAQKTDRVRTKEEVWRLVCRAIEQGKVDFPNMVVGYRAVPTERWHRRIRTGRGVVNLALYFQKAHPAHDHRGVEALERLLPPRLQRIVQTRLARAVLGRRLTIRAWRLLERLAPPSPTVVEVLRDVEPDVLIVSPAVWAAQPVEADYVRAARALGIPSVGYVNSWDNLTSKGTLQVVPDAFVVWNEALADEAVRIHAIPRKAIVVSGAPYLDPVFALRPARSHAEICRDMGCPNDNPYVLYLGTSRTLISSEVDIVTELADAIARRFPDNPPTLVVRPHPMNPYAWDGYEHPGVVVHPRVGGAASTPDSWREYYDQLSAATCTVGLNTSAFLEAVVADRPCLTIVGEKFYSVHEQTGHFRHLLDAGFLEVCEGTAEVATRVARILDGVDEKAEQRRAFAEWFLRPAGIDTPVAPGLADVIEGLAQHAQPRSRRRAAARPERAAMRRWPELAGRRVVAARTVAAGPSGLTEVQLALDDGRAIRLCASSDQASAEASFTAELTTLKPGAVKTVEQNGKPRQAWRAARALDEALLDRMIDALGEPGDRSPRQTTGARPPEAAAETAKAPAKARFVPWPDVAPARIVGAISDRYGVRGEQGALVIGLDDGRGIRAGATTDSLTGDSCFTVELVGLEEPARNGERQPAHAPWERG